MGTRCRQSAGPGWRGVHSVQHTQARAGGGTGVQQGIRGDRRDRMLGLAVLDVAIF